MRSVLVLFTCLLAACSAPGSESQSVTEVSSMERQETSPDHKAVLLRLQQPPTEAQLQQLRELGVRIGGITGSIVSASAPVDQLPAIQTLPFVERLELSHPRPGRR